MSNWISITTDSLNDAKVSALVDALRTAALAPGQTDPSPRIIQSVIDRIRAEVAGCRTNLVDQDLTKIPKSLELLAARMILAALKNRLEIALTENERDQVRSDEGYLRRISSCQVPIDIPDNPISAPVEPNAAIQISTKSKRTVSRCNLKGLT